MPATDTDLGKKGENKKRKGEGKKRAFISLATSIVTMTNRASTEPRAAYPSTSTRQTRIPPRSADSRIGSIPRWASISGRIFSAANKIYDVDRLRTRPLTTSTIFLLAHHTLPLPPTTRRYGRGCATPFASSFFQRATGPTLRVSSFFLDKMGKRDLDNDLIQRFGKIHYCQLRTYI